MYLSILTIENFRCFGEGANRIELYLKPGLTALVGENDKGKSAVIDALRFALGTTDLEWYRLEDTDFHVYSDKKARQIRFTCKFEGLNFRDKAAFIEYLTYGEKSGDEPVLYVNWTAEDTGERRKGQPYRRVEVCSGRNGDGPTISSEVRDLLRAIYLRPLRDAEQALSAGRGSRLAQVLRHSALIKNGAHQCDLSVPLTSQNLSILGIGKLINDLLEEQEGVKVTQSDIDKNLALLSLRGDNLKGDIKVGGADASSEVRLRELLEKLDLRLLGEGKHSLGSNNLLFMACELLLLAQEQEGTKLLLIEEPEAHLHAQRQLQIMRFLQKQANENGIQIVVTTHSPNLASVIPLDNIVMISDGHAFSMAKEETELEATDYRFLERFLDATKANLFFARGLVIVEGDAENILLPTLARILDCDFTEYGVSIVNVGGVGLRRYARIFKRRNLNEKSQLRIPVACITDMDVMPDCAPNIIGKLRDNEDWPEISTRRQWRAKKDFGNADALAKHREDKISRASGHYVRTFVSDEWTLEYDLALGPKNENGVFEEGLAEDVFVAACLAAKDDDINTKKITVEDVESAALRDFAQLRAEVTVKEDCSLEEVLASRIYAKFAKDHVSKAVSAQYLAERLLHKWTNGQLGSSDLRRRLPKYVVASIDYVTCARDRAVTAVKQEATANE